MAFPTFVCRSCKRKRRFHGTMPSTRSTLCFRCKLRGNKPLLLKNFNSITETDEMKQFAEESKGWYPDGRESR